MSTPHFAIALLQELAARGAVRLGFAPALKRLLPFLGTEAHCREFALSVLANLTLRDFSSTVVLPAVAGGERTIHDVYAPRLRNELLTPFGLEDKNTWYLKVTVMGQPGELVSVLSLHCLEVPMKMADKKTTRSPNWKEGDK